jgi:hypothetical protein
VGKEVGTSKDVLAGCCGGIASWIIMPWRRVSPTLEEAAGSVLRRWKMWRGAGMSRGSGVGVREVDGVRKTARAVRLSAASDSRDTGCGVLFGQGTFRI